jgi:hypothetical protein
VTQHSAATPARPDRQGIGVGQTLAAGGLVGVCPGIDHACPGYMIQAFGRFIAGERVPVGGGLSGAPARAER